jgi:hypothetical protein
MKTTEEAAEMVLRAAGSSLKNYTMPETREKILTAVKDVQHDAALCCLRWLPIGQAEMETGKEILGVRFHGGIMTKEPFISFWSPSLNKFYLSPTHYQPMTIPLDQMEK